MDHQDIDDEPEPSYKSIFCQSCGTEITSTQNIAAERFQGRLGPATLYKTAINITVMSTQSRELLSGIYQVSDVSCRSCSNVIGWYYYQVTNKNNEWKIGKYCLEDKLANPKRVHKSPVIQRPSRAPIVKPAQSAVSSMMTMMSPAAVVNAVVRSSSKMMSSSLDDEDDRRRDEREAESESSDEDDDASVCSNEAVREEDDDVVDDDDDDDESDGEEESDQDDVDEWEVVELIEMPA